MWKLNRKCQMGFPLRVHHGSPFILSLYCVILIICEANHLITKGKTEADKFHTWDDKKGLGWGRAIELPSSDGLFQIIQCVLSLCVNWVCHLIFLENKYWSSSCGCMIHLFICTIITIFSTKCSRYFWAYLYSYVWNAFTSWFFQNLCIYRPFSRGNFTGCAFGWFTHRWKARAS